MTDQNERLVAKRSRAPKRRFYRIGPNFALVGFSIEDRSVFPPYGVARLPASTPQVSVMFDRSVGRLPCDLEGFWNWWLVSERTKALFEKLEPEAFVFVPCAVRMRRGQYDGPKFWLCDVIRVLDALDEPQSHLRVGIRDNISFIDHGQKYYKFLTFGGKLVFREPAIGNAHIFRMAYADHAVICDQEFKDACKSGGLRKIMFRDVLKI